MKKVLLGVVLGAFAWQAYLQWKGPSAPSHPGAQEHISSDTFVDSDDGDASAPASEQTSFACDGRTLCSQMTSCAEAEYFLKNCPGVEMDGNDDGEPCEMQWCSNGS